MIDAAFREGSHSPRMRALQIVAAGTNTDSGSLSSAPCVSPLGDRRMQVRPAPIASTTRATASRIKRMRFSGLPP